MKAIILHKKRQSFYFILIIVFKVLSNSSSAKQLNKTELVRSFFIFETPYSI